MIVALDNDTADRRDLRDEQSQRRRHHNHGYGRILDVVSNGVNHVLLTTHYDQLVGE